MGGIERAEERLLAAIAKGHAPHACFFACPDEDMAAAVALRAAALHCTGVADAGRLSGCADCIVPDSFKVDAIRDITSELAKSSFHGGGRAVVLLNAHTMNEPAQNALLKTLEEPPERTMFLLTGNDAGLLPTVLSRCATVRCGMPDAEFVANELMALGASREEAALYSRAGVTLAHSRRLYQDADLRALRDNAQEVLKELFAGKLPFERIPAIASQEGAHFMLSFARDMLSFKERGEILENPDHAGDIAAMCARLATRRIRDTILALANALERMATNASPQATFTRLFTEITEEL